MGQRFYQFHTPYPFSLTFACIPKSPTGSRTSKRILEWIMQRELCSGPRHSFQKVFWRDSENFLGVQTLSFEMTWVRLK
jgi:hypothetical protein